MEGSTSEGSKETRQSYVLKWKAAEKEDRDVIYAEAKKALGKKAKEGFISDIAKIVALEKELEESENEDGKKDDDDDDKSDDGKTLVEKNKGKEKEGEPKRPTLPALTEAEIDAFFKELHNLPDEDLVNEETIEAMKFIGFDPEIIVRSILMLGGKAKKSLQDVLKDVSNMCAIAIIKGSITDNNLAKMSDSGKAVYRRYEEVYELKKGGKKHPPEVITIARVAASFPGTVMRILIKRPDIARTYAGPYGSKVLPSVMKHQAIAAVIPNVLNEKVKNFLLGIVTAFSADQTKTISKSKDSAIELWTRQENFVNTTHSSKHPTEDVRVAIFKTLNLTAHWVKIKIVADAIIKLNPAFEMVTQEEFQAAVIAV